MMNTMVNTINAMTHPSMKSGVTSCIRYVLVFDFETNNLPKHNWAAFEPWPTYKKCKNGNLLYHYRTEPNQNGVMQLKKECVLMPASNPSDWPHAVQLSYILYDLQTHKKKIVNQKFRLPPGVTMSEGSQNIHKMSLEENQTSDYPYIQDVLDAVKIDFDKADMYVAHNIHFDRNVLLAELTRHSGQNPTLSNFLNTFYHNKKEYCTMRHGVGICKLEAVNCNGIRYFKMPKLAHLYTHLFGCEPDADRLHDALYDVMVCLRCFYKMVFDRDLIEMNPKLFQTQTVSVLHRASVRLRLKEEQIRSSPIM